MSWDQEVSDVLVIFNRTDTNPSRMRPRRGEKRICTFTCKLITGPLPEGAASHAAWVWDERGGQVVQERCPPRFSRGSRPAWRAHRGSPAHPRLLLSITRQMTYAIGVPPAAPRQPSAGREPSPFHLRGPHSHPPCFLKIVCQRCVRGGCPVGQAASSELTILTFCCL